MVFDQEMIHTLTQVTIAIGTIGAVIYMAITGREIPDVLTSIAMVAVGYLFRTGVEVAARRMAARINN